MGKVSDGVPYKILSSLNLLALDVHGGQPQDRIPIVPYHWGGRANQIWIPEHIGITEGSEDIFILTSLADRSYVMDNSEREKGRILMFSKHGRENQQWVFEPVEPNAFDFFIRNVKDGMVLELTRNGNDVRLNTRNAANKHQRWTLSEA